MSAAEYLQADPRGDDSLFARDEIDGRLVRMRKATDDDLKKRVMLTIDGHAVDVPMAVLATDAEGKFVKDENGLVKRRFTTIHDAADDLYRRLGRPNPIPTLCHLGHLDPVAVCRVCTVFVAKYSKRAKAVTPAANLAPACQHKVENDMVVVTLGAEGEAEAKARERVQSSVRVVTELLLADHPSPCVKEQRDGNCELEELGRRLEITTPRFGRRAERTGDDSSLLIAVDHDACILCDRCVRGCNDVKNNQVIGRMGKGYQARIAFDLNAPMGSSSCVSCGECMVSCPTGALTHRSAINTHFWDNADPPAQPVTVEELAEHPLPEIRAAFDRVSRPFLEWNARAIVRRRFAPGQLICREGDYGSSAFFIEKGAVEIYRDAPLTRVESRPVKGLLGIFSRFRSEQTNEGETKADRRAIPADAPVTLPYGNPRAMIVAGEYFGEMACLNNQPRAATVRGALMGGCTVLEMQRNVIDIMRRSRGFRADLERKYRERGIENHLASVAIFAELRDDPEQYGRFVAGLRKKVQFRRCDPGEVIFRQGDPATDGFYLVRTGFVKATQDRPGGEFVLNYVGPGGYIGEIALMAEVLGLPMPVRTANCIALDHVDLVRIPVRRFRAILRRYPRVRELLESEARQRLEQTRAAALRAADVSLGDFLDQGLMHASSLLVLDLEKCTRCDECTKACADTHDGHTRLIREGLRFDKFLVATSCRSCLDPYCMVGCPVDAIHRTKTNEIRIEMTCIGCGKCSENCPYGNITMHEIDRGPSRSSADDRPAMAPVTRKATTCDLCRSLGPNHKPSCVYACPHDAAHRMTGTELLDLVRIRGQS